MEHLPSIFNEFWDFLIVPFFELLVLLSIFYSVTDKPELYQKLKAISQKLISDYTKLKESVLTPLGINAATSVSVLVILVSIIVIINKFTHFSGDIVPGNLSTFTTFSLVEYSDRDILASIWSTKPNIPDVDNLYRYISEVYYKNIQSFPELAKTDTYRNNEVGSIMAYRTFEKFLLIYVVIILPILLKRFKIKTHKYIVKAFGFTVLILILLTINFWHQFESIKTEQFSRVYNCSIMLADEIAKTKTDSTKIFYDKISTYDQRLKRYGELPVNVVFDR